MSFASMRAQDTDCIIILPHIHSYRPKPSPPLSCSRQTTIKNIKSSSAENITVTIRGVLGEWEFFLQCSRKLYSLLCTKNTL